MENITFVSAKVGGLPLRINTDLSLMKTMQREFEALLDMQRFDAGELDYAVLDRHVARLTQLSQVVNSGITVFDMYRRRHVFSSYNFPDLFRYDMDRIASEDSDYFSARIHPDDLPDVHRNGIDCLRFMLGHKELIDNGKFLTEYRIEIGGRYVVAGVQVDEGITRRLEALGVNEGTPVNILNKKGSGSVIIKVRGTRLALGRRLSEGITVREEHTT